MKDLIIRTDLLFGRIEMRPIQMEVGDDLLLGHHITRYGRYGIESEEDVYNVRVNGGAGFSAPPAQGAAK
jgi:hypothetical protein